MVPTEKKTHWRQVFRWAGETQIDWVAILAAGIGMAGPVLFAALAGDLSAGLAASVGSLLLGGIGANSTWRAQLRELTAAFVPAAMALTVAVPAAGHGGLSDAIVTLVAGAAAEVAGLSRRMVATAMRFILCMIIVIVVAETVPDRSGLAVLILAGALWTCAVSLLLGAVARAYRPADDRAIAVDAPQPTSAQRLQRWRRSLAGLSGWHYAIRLTLCLDIAGVLRSLWPDHHFYWITLTVALLAEWQIEVFPVRTTQRAVGAALGVLATGLLLVYSPPIWGLVVGIGVLAAARPLLRARNYLAYTAVMTPLIVVLMDAGRPFGIGVLIDRLLATFIGAALVIGANWIFSKAVARPGNG